MAAASIISLILLVTALGVIGYFIKIIVSTFSFIKIRNLNSFVDDFKIKRKSKVLDQIDRLIDEKKIDESIELLEGSFVIDLFDIDKNKADEFLNHNLSVLERFVNISDLQSKHFTMLPILEGLLTTRTELYVTSIEISDNLKKLKTKYTFKNKDNYKWAFDEIQAKANDIHQKLSTNKKNIEIKIKELIHEVRNTKGKDSSDYEFH
jgi:hypothetical protein